MRHHLCSSVSHFLLFCRFFASSTLCCTDQPKWEFKLRIDLLLACGLFSFIVCMCVVFPASSWTDVMPNGNTLTELPVQWSEWPAFLAAWWSWSDYLTRGRLVLTVCLETKGTHMIRTGFSITNSHSWRRQARTEKNRLSDEGCSLSILTDFYFTCRV